MSALQDLSLYAQSGRALVDPAVQAAWHLESLRPETAKRAAVLMLFGTLDDRPAAFQSNAVASDLDVLLIRRAGSLNHHPGQIAFPGGRIDSDDSHEIAAALREAEEETGVNPAGVEVLGALPEVALPISNFLVTPVLAWWAAPSSVSVVDEGESSHVFRIPVADLLDPANRRTAVVRRRGLTGRSPAFITREATVWGFTAMLLDGLFEGLGWTSEWDPTREIPAPV